MKALSISETQQIESIWHENGGREVVTFSDGKKYEALIFAADNGWDCALRLLSSRRTVTSPLRRKMVLQHLGLESAVTRQEKSRVNNLHRNLPKYGCRLRKSHASKYPNQTNRGGYKVTNGNVAVLGPNFDATLEQVEEFLAARVAEFKAEGVR